MNVVRIVANVPVNDPMVVHYFYAEILGLSLVMDQGWICTYASAAKMAPQLSFVREGGSGAPIPDLSIEVDDLAEAISRMRNAQVPFEYGPVSESWGVRRVFVRDPLGRLINILQHEL